MLRSSLVVACLAGAFPVIALAQTTARVSVDANGVQGNNYSGTYGDAISADGRYVAFGSGATNLVPGGSPLQWELFRKDRLTGAIAMISVDASGTPGAAGSFYPSISADGSAVAFESDSGFGTGDTNGRRDIFVHDFATGSTSLVSVTASGAQWADPCQEAAISGDGRHVAFSKTHQVNTGGRGGGYHHRTDVLVHDRLAGNTEVVNINTNGVQTTALYSSSPSLSFDGRYIAFTSSAADLVAGDTNGSADVFVRDMQLAVTTRVSLDSLGGEGNGDSLSPSLSFDGRFVAFASAATNLVPGDLNGHADIFVHDNLTGTTVLASVDANGVQADADCLAPAISADGRFVTFHSVATTLAPGDANHADDVFVRDLLRGTTERVSVALAGDADGPSDKPSISADGRLVAFRSYASNLVAGDTNGTYDVFVRDRGATGAFTALAGDGCPGSAGTPLHTATGTPEIGNAVQYSLAHAPAAALAVAVYGFSATRWNTMPLPLDLGVIGAPGCWLRIEPLIQTPGLTGPDGTLTDTIAIAGDRALIGIRFFTQFAAFDPPANTSGLTVSNAIGTTVGGWE